MKISIFWDNTPVIWCTSTDFSEKPDNSIFGVKYIKMKEEISFETFIKLYSIHGLISLNLLLKNFSFFPTSSELNDYE
jgi:hypothetical protein